MQTSLKEVKIIAKYTHKTNGKPNGRISYLVRSSSGRDIYCTTLINGEASGCSCPSRKPCYHMIQLTQRETARTAKKVTDESSSRLPEDLRGRAKVCHVKGDPIPGKSTDVGSRGNLNTSRAFSLMR